MSEAFLTVVSFVAIYYAIYKVFSRLYDSSHSRRTWAIYNDVCSTERYWLNVAEREIRFERFTAWSECPECLTLDLHTIKDRLPQSCRRECTNCHYVWRQK